MKLRLKIGIIGILSMLLFLKSLIVVVGDDSPVFTQIGIYDIQITAPASVKPMEKFSISGSILLTGLNTSHYSYRPESPYSAIMFEYLTRITLRIAEIGFFAEQNHFIPVLTGNHTFDYVLGDPVLNSSTWIENTTSINYLFDCQLPVIAPGNYEVEVEIELEDFSILGFGLFVYPSRISKSAIIQVEEIASNSLALGLVEMSPVVITLLAVGYWKKRK